MKDYRQVTADVLRRSEEIIKQKHRRSRLLLQLGATAACLCIAAFLGFDAWNRDISAKEPTELEPAYSMDVGDTSQDGNPKGCDALPESATLGEEISGTDQEENSNSGQETASFPALSPGDGEAFSTPITPMISSYGEGSGSSACYKSPDNGTFAFSAPLQGALSEYGDSAKYRVVVDIFRDNNPLNPGSDEVKDEIERFVGCGYTVAYETYNDGVNEYSYLTLHATSEQLESFAAEENYGYMLFLYDERVIER